MLLGPAMTQRTEATDAEDLATIDGYLAAVTELLPQVYGDDEASQQAVMEFQRFQTLPADHDGLLCRRAALLFALAREPEVGAHLEAAGGASAAYARDLRERVLPFILPRYLRNSCQAPDAFVVLSCVLSELWAGEPLGNWPQGEENGETHTTICPVGS